MDYRIAAFLFLLLSATAVNAKYISSTDTWEADAGDFSVGEILGGGGSNAIHAQYNSSTEIFQLSSNYLPGFPAPLQPYGNVVFSLTALVAKDTGEFAGGAFNMLVGSAGLGGSTLSPGSLLISGTVLELDSLWVPVTHQLCDGCLWPETPGTPALLEIGFAAPELALATDYLTLFPYIAYTTGSLETIWSNSFDINGSLGWTLFETTAVPEPGSVALLCLGLFLIACRYRRNKLRA